MLGGIAIVSVSYLMLAYVSNLLQFYFVVSVCMGLGMATMGGPVWHRSVMNWFDHWRGRAIAFAVMSVHLWHCDAALGERYDRSHRLA